MIDSRAVQATGSTDRSFTLAIEAPVALTTAHEVQLLRAALERNPTAPVLREKLAFLVFTTDHFDEAIALLEGLVAEAPRFGLLHVLTSAYLSREMARDDVCAEGAARQALEHADGDAQRGAALALLGKCLARQDRLDEARTALRAALTAAPNNADAYKRLVAIALKTGDVAEAIAVSEDLFGQGVAHSRLLVGRTLALATSGRIDAARAAIGLDRYLTRRQLEPPPGWPTIAVFNTAIKGELARHPDLRYDRYGSASTRTWRIDQPAIAGTVAIPALQGAIQAAVMDYVHGLPEPDVHPWVRARPSVALLHNWCVMTDADGFEEWHVHQHGWLSGVYYVDVPPTVAAATGREGCIAFGLPEDLVGGAVANAYGEQIVRPANGLLLLFPSHTYHRTFAHGSAHRRICLAFDIKPQ